MKDHSSDVVKSREVLGVPVINAENESLGKIEEFVLNKQSGQVLYVVLSFGGFLGMGDKYFAFPWKSISYCQEEKSFILNVSKDKLKDAEGFDKDHWPNVNDELWGKRINDYYGVY